MAEEHRAPASGQQPQRQRRVTRQHSRKSKVAGAFLYVLFVIGLSAVLATVGWVWANDLLALNKEYTSAIITVPDDAITYTQETDEDGNTYTVSKADMDEIVDQLKENGLIQYKFLFQLYSMFSNADEKIVAGTYELNTDMDYRALISNMGSGSSNRMTTTVTIPEGMTEAQIFALLEEKGVCTVEDLEDTAANYDFKFTFLKGVLPLGDATRLEGYLFPDTYEFYMGEDPVSVLNKMILRFDEIFTEQMRADIQASGHTINDAVIIASMIEKETDGGDQAEIASVIYNRLDDPTSETAGFLNIDATILYATGGTTVDTAADTPYNTYTHTGLPPTPIASPGVDALRAAVYPEDTNYYFYALGDDGVHHFFSTSREQQNFIASQERYQNG